MVFYSFPSRQPVIATQLPLTLISLEDWALATLTGVDSEKYLQSQVTVDVNRMTKHQYLIAAHCDPKGKMWSNLLLFRRQDGFAFIERRSLRDVQLAELKKYAVFSKVIITANDENVLLGLAGFQARSALRNLFSTLPNADAPLVNDSQTSLLWFEYPAERFLLVTNVENAMRIVESLRDRAQMNNSQQWLALNIEAGDPVIDTVNSGQFIPQAANLQALGGINFKKGCYTGQEMVVRAKFRGANKRALWYLVGHADRIPEAGESLELKINKNWRRTGTILASVRLNDGRLLVQAIMNNNIEMNSVLRVINDTNTLGIEPLPYLLDN